MCGIFLPKWLSKSPILREECAFIGNLYLSCNRVVNLSLLAMTPRWHHIPKFLCHRIAAVVLIFLLWHDLCNVLRSELHAHDRLNLHIMSARYVTMASFCSSNGKLSSTRFSGNCRHRASLFINDVEKLEREVQKFLWRQTETDHESWRDDTNANNLFFFFNARYWESQQQRSTSSASWRKFSSCVFIFPWHLKVCQYC